MNWIGILFIIIGLLVTVFGINIVRKASTSKNWPTATGIVESAVVARSIRSDSEGTRRTYKADIVYTYEVGGEKYTSGQVYFGRSSSSNSARAHRLVHRYPEGATVTVHYNPEEPHVAVLEPGIKASSYLLLGIGLIFAVVGVIITLEPILL